MNNSTQIEVCVQFRKRATRKLTFGFFSAAGIVAVLVVLSNDGYIPKSVLWSILAVVPFAYYVTGTIEFIIQRPYRDLATAWKTLQRSQKAQLGIFLVIVALLVLTLGVAAVLNVWIIARGDA